MSVVRTVDLPPIRGSERSEFLSTVQTGTGSAQNVAHGLKRTPTRVRFYIMAGHNGAGGSGTQCPAISPGTHTDTNVVVTVTAGATFLVDAD